MKPGATGTGPFSGGESAFTTTHWSVVVAAGHRDSPEAAEALETLCRTYWYPLYAYVRRCGYSCEDAQDLTQEFFAQLLAKDFVARADPLKGKFRSFLLAGLKHLLGHDREKARRLKRGGGRTIVSIDAQTAEDRYRSEPADELTPERLFEQSWASTLIERAAVRLRDEYSAADKAELFEELCGFRLDAPEPRAYAEVSARLGLSESAVKSAIRRFRQRHHQLVREEIAQTVKEPAEVDEEIRYLLRVLA